MRPLRGALAAVVVLLLAGCATIPMSGPAQGGDAEAPDAPNLVFQPVPPAAGASPDAIVRGFVAAAVEGGTYPVARQFMTPELAAAWQPDEGVLVHQEPWTTSIDGDRVVLRVLTSAEVDETGAYETAARAVRVPFDLVQVGGQWRIAETPDGIVLPQNVFQSTFRPYALQFFAPGFSALVPDLRWFPARRSAPRAIVNGLLRGPVPQLAGGVTATTFPPGSRLDAPISTIGDSVAVSIDVPGGYPGAQAAARMHQQLSRSLQVPTSADLRLILNGRRVPAPPPLQDVLPGLRPVVLAEGRFGPLSTRGVTVEPLLGERVAALEPSAVTWSARQQLATLLTADGVVVVTKDAQRRLDQRIGLAEPSLDQAGWIYSVPRSDPSAVIAFRPDGRATPLDGNLPGAAVIAIEVAPDGTRLLALVQTGGGARAVVVGIERAEDGTPTGLTSARYSVPVGTTGGVDATWVDDGVVAVLTTGLDEQGQSVVVQQLGGVATPLGRITNAEALVGTTGQEDLRALLDTGDVFQRQDNVWQSEFDEPVEVELLAVQR